MRRYESIVSVAYLRDFTMADISFRRNKITLKCVENNNLTYFNDCKVFKDFSFSDNQYAEFNFYMKNTEKLTYNNKNCTDDVPCPSSHYDVPSRY